MLTQDQINFVRQSAGFPDKPTTMGVSPSSINTPTDADFQNAVKARQAQITPLVGGGSTATDTVPPSTYGDLGTTAKGFGSDVAAGFKQAQTSMSDVAERALSGKQPIGSTIIQGLGAGAGLFNDIIGSGFKAIYNLNVPKSVQDVISSTASNIIQNSPVLKGGVDAAKQGMDAFNTWAKNNPQDAASISGLANIALAITQAWGLGETPKAVEAMAPKIEETISGATQGAKDLATAAKGAVTASDAEKTWNIVQPTLTKPELADAVKAGEISQEGALGTTKLIAKGRNLDMVNAATPYVKDTNNALDAVANLKQGITNEATALKNGVAQTGAIYSKSQIVGALSKIEEPTMIAADSTLNRAYQLVKNKMVSLVGDGGKLSDLLDARKSFDAFVQKQFPNLYASDTLTPMRQAIRDVRGALNDVIDSRLPDGTLPNGVSFRDSLKTQSLLYNAIDNTAPKVGKLGQNFLNRWIAANPGKAKLLGYGAVAVGGGTAAHFLGL